MIVHIFSKKRNISIFRIMFLIREELPGRIKHVPDLLHEKAPDAQHHTEWGVSVIETIQQHL